jgi:hypothetical protein
VLGQPLTSTRKSVSYNGGWVRTSYSYNSHYVHMLVEDIATGILPTSLTKDSGSVIALNTPSEEACELLSAGLRGESFGTRQDLPDALYWFMDETAHRVAFFGEALYEIVFLGAASHPHRFTHFALAAIPNNSVISALGARWQFVPRRVRAEGSRTPRVFNRLDPENLLVISMPKQLGGRRGIRGMLTQLSDLGTGVPEFHLREMPEHSEQTKFDLRVFTRIRNTMAGKLTSGISWDVRWLLLNERPITNFCLAHRRLQFEKSRAILRQTILESLNDALRRVGEQLRVDLQFRLEGLPSPNDYDNWIQQFEEGELGIAEVYDLVYTSRHSNPTKCTENQRQSPT